MLVSLVVIPFPWKSLCKPFRHVRLIVSSLTIWYTGCYFFPWTFSVSSCCVYHFYYYFLLYLCHSLQFNFWARQIRLVLFRRLYFYLFDTVVSVWILVIQYHNISVSLCCVYRFHSCIHCGYSGWYFIHCSYISEHFTFMFVFRYTYCFFIPWNSISKHFSFASLRLSFVLLISVAYFVNVCSTLFSVHRSLNINFWTFQFRLVAFVDWPSWFTHRFSITNGFHRLNISGKTSSVDYLSHIQHAIMIRNLNVLMICLDT